MHQLVYINTSHSDVHLQAQTETLNVAVFYWHMKDVNLSN